MSEDKLLQEIESVLLRARFYLYRVHSNDLKLIQAIRSITHDLQGLQSVITPPEEPQPQMYLLTQPDYFGIPAYLVKKCSGGWAVVVQDCEQTGTYPEPKTALDEYVEQCGSDDFIEDFMQEKHNIFGDSVYAVYVRKCFEAYMAGKVVN